MHHAEKVPGQQQLYKKCNEIERLFRRLRDFRRIFSRFEKLDVIFWHSFTSHSSSKHYE